MATIETKLRRLRVLAWIEGSSLLVLVGIAVPLKHVFGVPAVVSACGPLHGIAFLAYAVAILDALGTRQLAGRVAGVAILAAMVPGGSFLFARSLAHRPARAVGGGRPPPED